VRAPEGAVYAIARTDFDQWNSKQKDGVTMYTLEEVAIILQAWDRDIGGMASHKRAFPDSRLSVAKFAKPVPPIEDDDIPF
jgi:hypothetical protein